MTSAPREPSPPSRPPEPPRSPGPSPVSGPPSLAELTTLRVGGVPRDFAAPARPGDLVALMRRVWRRGEEWLLVGGGSNMVVSDDGFDGTVVHVATRGIERVAAGPAANGPAAVSQAANGPGAGTAADSAPGTGSGTVRTQAGGETVRLRVQAGEEWDALVAHTVRQGWSGVEALSGIPGLVGAAPVQNIGAYGQELASVLRGIDFLDYATGELRHLEAAELGFGYRTSVIKRGLAGVVVAVELALRAGDGRSEPVAYRQLADALGVPLGARVPLSELRRAVLAVRAAKGMVLDPADTDTCSAGSFFTNPVVDENTARRLLPASAPRWPAQPEPQDVAVPLSSPAAGAIDPQRYRRPARAVKLSAAWLIEHSGIGRGFRLPGSHAAISGKHTLAITNTGGARAAEIIQLAAFVRGRVQAEFGILLQPEPMLVGLSLD